MELCAILPEGFRDFLDWNILLFKRSIHMRSSVASCAVDKVMNIFWLGENQTRTQQLSSVSIEENSTKQSAHFMFHTSSSFEKPYKEHRSGKQRRGYCAVSNVLTSLIQFLLDVSPSLSPWIMIHINLNAHNCSKCVNCSYASSDVYCLDRRPCSDY